MHEKEKSEKKDDIERKVPVRRNRRKEREIMMNEE